MINLRRWRAIPVSDNKNGRTYIVSDRDSGQTRGEVTILPMTSGELKVRWKVERGGGTYFDTGQLEEILDRAAQRIEHGPHKRKSGPYFQDEFRD